MAFSFLSAASAKKTTKNYTNYWKPSERWSSSISTPRSSSTTTLRYWPSAPIRSRSASARSGFGFQTRLISCVRRMLAAFSW